MKPPGADDRLGLVGYKVLLSDDLERTQYTDADPLYVYANISAGRQGSGGLTTEGLEAATDSTSGYVWLFGGLAQGTELPTAMSSDGTRVVIPGTGGNSPDKESHGLAGTPTGQTGGGPPRPGTEGNGFSVNGWPNGGDLGPVGGQSGSWYGFQTRLFYDPFAAAEPPPAFPALNRFVVRTWREENLH